MRSKAVEQKHFPQISHWYRDRDMSIPHPKFFPETGFVVENIAAGFIYKTDSKICLLDGYISNPKTTKEDRKKALDIITSDLIIYAKESGFLSILAYTKNESIRKRCGKFLFLDKGDYTLHVREL